MLGAGNETKMNCADCKIELDEGDGFTSGEHFEIGVYYNGPYICYDCIQKRLRKALEYEAAIETRHVFLGYAGTINEQIYDPQNKVVIWTKSDRRIENVKKDDFDIKNWQLLALTA